MVVHNKYEVFDVEDARALLYRICWRVCANHRRRWAKHGAQEPVADEAASADAGPDAIVERNEKAELVQRTLDQMKEARRAAFVLTTVEGLTVEQASRVLDMSEHAIYRHLRAARAAIATQIRRANLGARSRQ